MTDAIKAGRRHSEKDMALIKAMFGEMKAYKGGAEAYYTKMSDYLKALGFEDEDGDGAVTMDEAEAQAAEGDAMKAVDFASLCEMVCEAVEDALAELGLIAEEGDADEAMRPYVEAVAKDLPGEDDDDEPECLVYATHAVAMLGPASWRIPYRLEGGEVVLGDPDTWQRVEAEWKPVPGAAPVQGGEMKVERYIGSAIKLLSEDDDRVIGQAVLFGDEDHHDLSPHKDYFTKSTEFWLDQWDRRPMLFHHAIPEWDLVEDMRREGAPPEAIKAMTEAIKYLADNPVIGTWTKAWVDPAAVWLEGQLSKAHRYRGAIKEMIRRGVLKLSSDSAPHLVRREARPSGAHEVKRWPLLAASVTSTAAEPRLLDVTTTKTAMLADLGLTIDDGAHEAQPTADPREVPPGTKAADDGRAAALLARLSTLKETH